MAISAENLYKQLFGGLKEGDGDTPTLRRTMQTINDLKTGNAYLAEQNRIRDVQAKLIQQDIAEQMKLVRAENARIAQIEKDSAAQIKSIQSGLFDKEAFDSKERELLGGAFGQELTMLAAENTLLNAQARADNAFGDVSDKEIERRKQAVDVATETVANLRADMGDKGYAAFNANREQIKELADNPTSSVGTVLRDALGATASTGGSLVDAVGSTVLGGLGGALGGLVGKADEGADLFSAPTRLVGNLGRAAGDALSVGTQSEALQGLQTEAVKAEFDRMQLPVEQGGDGRSFFDALQEIAPAAAGALTPGGVLQVGSDLAGALAVGGPLGRAAGAAARGLGATGTAATRAGQLATRSGTPTVVAAGANQFGEAAQDTSGTDRVQQAATQLAGSTAIGLTGGALGRFAPTVESTLAQTVGRASSIPSTAAAVAPRALSSAEGIAARTAQQAGNLGRAAVTRGVPGVGAEFVQESTEDVLGQFVEQIPGDEPFQLDRNRTAIAGLQGATIGGLIAGGAGTGSRVAEARRAGRDIAALTPDVTPDALTDTSPEAETALGRRVAAGRGGVTIDGLSPPTPPPAPAGSLLPTARPAPAGTDPSAPPIASDSTRGAAPATLPTAEPGLAVPVGDPTVGAPTSIAGDTETSDPSSGIAGAGTLPDFLDYTVETDPATGESVRLIGDATITAATKKSGPNSFWTAQDADGTVIAQATDEASLVAYMRAQRTDTSPDVYTTASPDNYSTTKEQQLLRASTETPTDALLAAEADVIFKSMEGGTKAISVGRHKSRNNDAARRLLSEGILTYVDKSGAPVPTRWSINDDGTLNPQPIKKAGALVALNPKVSVTDGSLDGAGISPSGSGTDAGVSGSGGSVGTPVGSGVAGNAPVDPVLQEPNIPVSGTPVDPTQTTPVVPVGTPTGSGTGEVRPAGGPSTNNTPSPEAQEALRRINAMADKSAYSDLVDEIFDEVDPEVFTPEEYDNYQRAYYSMYHIATPEQWGETAPDVVLDNQVAVDTARAYTANLSENEKTAYAAITETMQETMSQYVDTVPEILFTDSPTSVGRAVIEQGIAIVNPFAAAGNALADVDTAIGNLSPRPSNGVLGAAAVTEVSLHELGHVITHTIIQEEARRNPEVMKGLLRDYRDWATTRAGGRRVRATPALRRLRQETVNNTDADGFNTGDDYIHSFSEYLADGFANSEIRRSIRNPETLSIMERIGSAVKDLYTRLVSKGQVSVNKPLDQLLADRRQFIRDRNAPPAATLESATATPAPRTPVFDTPEVKKNFGEQTSSLGAALSEDSSSVGSDARRTSAFATGLRRVRSAGTSQRVFGFSGVGGLSQTIKDVYRRATDADLTPDTESFVIDDDIYINDSLYDTPAEVQGAVLRATLSTPSLRAKAVPMTSALNTISKELGGVEAMQSSAGARTSSPAYEAALGTGRTARIAEQQMAIDTVTDMPAFEMNEATVDAVTRAGKQAKNHIITKYPELKDWARDALSPMAALEMMRSNPTTQLENGQQMASWSFDDRPAAYENHMLRRTNLGTIAETYKRNKATFGELTDMAGVKSKARDKVAADRRADAITDADLKKLGFAGLLVESARIGLRDAFENDSNMFNRFAQRMGHDRRTLKIRTAKWMRQIQSRANSTVDTIRSAAPALIAAANDARNGDFAPEFANYIKSITDGKNMYDLLNVFENQDLAQNTANFRYSEEIGPLQSDVTITLNELGDVLHNDGVTRPTTSEITSVVNTYMQYRHTPELLRAKMYTDNDLVSDLASAAGIDLASISDPELLIDQLFVRDPDGTIQSARTPAINKALNQSFQDTGISLDGARTGLAQMRVELSPAAIAKVDRVVAQTQRIQQRANELKDASGMPRTRPPEGVPMTHSYPITARTHTLDDIAETSLSGDTVKLAEKSRGTLLPMSAIDSQMVSTIYQTELNKMRDSMVLNTLATRALKDFGADTDNAFQGDLRVVRVGDEEYARAFSQARDGSTDVMVHHLPQEFNPDGEQLAVILENFQRDARDKTIIDDVTSNKDENAIVQGIRESENIYFQAAAGAAGFQARQTTTFNSKYWALGLVKDLGQNLFVAATEEGLSGAIDYGREAGSIMRNFAQVNRYARASVDQSAAGRAKLDKLLEDPMIKDLHDFRKAGGMPDFLRMLQDPSVRDRDSLITRWVPRNLEQKPETAIRAIESIARTGDMVARFAAFRTFRNAGATTQNAAARSYDVAAFARTGESGWADMGAMMFSFFRSGATGAIKTIDNVLASKYNLETMAVATGLAGAMFGLAMVMGGEDENGENRFLKEGLNSSGIKLFMPGIEEGVQLPIPYGGPGLMMYNTFQTLFALTGAQSGTESLTNIVDQTFKNVLPISNGIPIIDDNGETQFLKKFGDMMFPSALKPAYQAAVLNTNDFGSSVDPLGDYSNSLTRTMQTPRSLIGGASEAFVRELSKRTGIELSVRRIDHIMRNTVPGAHALADGLFQIGNFATGNAYDMTAKKLLFPLSPLIASPSKRDQRDFYIATNKARELTGRVKQKAASEGISIQEAAGDLGVDPAKYQKAVEVTRYAGQVRQARGDINNIYERNWGRDKRLESTAPLTERVEQTQSRLVRELREAGMFID